LYIHAADYVLGITAKATPAADTRLAKAKVAHGVEAGTSLSYLGRPMPRPRSLRWYARPVLFVSDMDRSIAFYVGQLGFKEHWRYEDAGETLVAQVDRRSCEHGREGAQQDGHTNVGRRTDLWQQGLPHRPRDRPPVHGCFPM
jgi:hypothetical protein